MNGTKAKPSLLHVPRLKVSATALEWVSHAGVGLLREVADLSGLSSQVREVLADTFKGPWVHDPGSVFTDLAAAVADGADCMSGIGQLLDQQAQHGPVASVTTSWRMIDQRIDAQHLAGVTKSTVREKVWAAGGAPQVGTTLVIDVDATITIDQYEGKEHPASTWKRTCGYHQLLAVLDRPDISDGEALAALLRGGERRLQYRRRSHHYVDRGVGVGGRPSTGPRHSGDNIAGHRAGEGLPSSRRHSSARSTPHTPEGSWRLRFQVLHRVHGLRRANSGSAPLLPPSRAGPLTTLQVCPSCCGPRSCSPKGAFATGLRPRPFPTEAASLLPGLLTATRTGLTPASDDEHEPSDHPVTRHLQFRWAHA